MMGNVLTLDLDGRGARSDSPPLSEASSRESADAPPPWCVMPEMEPDPDWLEYVAAQSAECAPEYGNGWEECPNPGPHDWQEPVPHLDPEPRPRGAPTTVFYIDADNQSAQCAADLVSLFRDDLAVGALRAVIAGNNSGSQIDIWARELAAAAPDIEALALDVPSRKDAADVALIIELGANLERHRRDGDLVVAVSRDDLLVGAAEYAKARGCRAFAALVDSDPPCARSSRVATLLLPTPGKQRPARPPVRRLVSTLPSLARKPAEQSAQSAPKPEPTPANPGPDPAAVLARLREQCKPAPGGGYCATEIGQALKNLGFADAKTRAQFLKTTPGIQPRGSGTRKVYVF
jgi:hypothetical protein